MSAWLYAISIMGQAVSMMFAGGIEAKVGSKKCTLIGCIGFLLCVACSYWAVCNFYLLMFVYGFMFGFFLGLAYSAPISMGTLSVLIVTPSHQVDARQGWSGFWYYCRWLRLRFSCFQPGPVQADQSP